MLQIQESFILNGLFIEKVLMNIVLRFIDF